MIKWDLSQGHKDGSTSVNQSLYVYGVDKSYCVPHRQNEG